MTNMSRYLVNVSLTCYRYITPYLNLLPQGLSDFFMIHFLRFLIISSYSLLAAPADVLTPGRGCAECGGGPVTSLLPGSEQKAVESTDVPGCWSRGHSSPRHAEPGENR